MATKPTKVRLVRCPKCFKLLPEWESLPVYQCGGCGTTLKAKKRVEDHEGESSAALHQNSTQRRESELGYEKDKELSTSRKTTVNSSDESEQSEYRNTTSPREPELHGSNGSLSVEGNIRSDGHLESGSDLETPRPDNVQNTSGGSNFSIASRKTSSDSSSSKLKASPVREELGKSETFVVRRYANLIGAKVTGKSAKATDDSVESEDDTVGVSKPTATKSLHAYDASISSNDGWGDQGSNIHSYQSKRSSFGSEKLLENTDPNGGSTREDVPVNNGVAVNSELHDQVRKFSSMSMNESRDPVGVESSSPGQDVLPKNTRYGIEDQKQVHSRDRATVSPAPRRLEGERRELKDEKRLKDSSASHPNKDPSKYRHKKLNGSCLYSPQNIMSIEQNKVELLRKVDELREQLNRSYDITGKANDWFPTTSSQQQRPLPLYYNQTPPDHDMMQRRDVNLHMRSPGRYVPSKSVPLQGGYSKMPLSGNVMNHVHHVNCMCLNAYREDWQCLQQFPPSLCYNEMPGRPYSDHVYYNTYGSSSTSPEQHLHPHYPLPHSDISTLPYSHIDENHPRKERPQVVKKHCLPIASGAPLVICHHCQRVLYLPADAFLSNKKSHKLQCGSCSKVLTFSLHQGTHLAPYPQHPDLPTRQKVYDSSASSSVRNSAATYNGNGVSLGDPVSFSEDYGRSTFKSVSTETETNALSRKQASSRLNGVAKKSGNKQKKVMHASDSDSPSPSDDARLRKELLKKVTAPTLHQLMGYPSPSRVLNCD